jgi:hypothetical protein
MAEKDEGKGLLAQLRSIGAYTTGLMFGSSEERRAEDRAKRADVKDLVARVSSRYQSTTGPDVVEFLAQAELQADDDKGKGGKKKSGKKLLEINSIVEGADQKILSNMMFMEMDRITGYDTYAMIHKYIPQLSDAIKNYRDSILSPDDFTKDTFTVHYEASEVEAVKLAVERLDQITERYGLEEKSKKIIDDTLILGDQFVATLSLDRELQRLLLEGADPKNLMILSNEQIGRDLGGFLTESESALTEEEITDLGILIEEEGKEDPALNELNRSLMLMINENLSFGDSKTILREKAETEMIMNNATGGSALEAAKEREAAEKQKAIDGWKMVNGSVVKVLDPRRVVKLQVDDVCYGYYYVEKASNTDFGKKPAGRHGSDAFTSAFTGAGNDEAAKKTKSDMVADIFIKRIGKRVNNELLAKNPEFKTIMYNLLKQGALMKEQMKITYLRPDEVEHFMINEEDGYGVSIYRDILFTAKLYLAVLTTTLMNKLVRGPDKRVFYVEVGLDNDTEGVIQQFIRDVKSRDIKMNDLKDINTILNNVGIHNDYFIPMINNERPVDIETMSGSEATLDNEFLEYLRKTMISGIGVPSAFLNYSEDVEFARSLAMQNGRFVRSIVVLQKCFGKGFTRLYRTLYRNEYPSEAEKRESKPTATPKTKGEGEGKPAPLLLGEAAPKPKGKAEDRAQTYEIEARLIEVRFPSPASLNTTNMTEQVNNSQTVVDFIVATLAGDDTPEDAKRELKLQVTKDLVTTVDWARYENMAKDARIKAKRDALLSNEEDPASKGGGLADV